MPKISTVEAFLLVIAGIVADLINWIPVVNWLVAIFMFPITQLYFRMKGVRGHYALIGNIVELIPGLSVLPAYTLSMIATIFLDRHPQLTEKISTTSKKAKSPLLKPAAEKKVTEVIKKT